MRFEDDPLSVLTSGKAKLWVLLVGVNHYEDERLASLNFAVSDCQGLAEALADATQCFPNKNVIVHCSASTPTTLEGVWGSLQQIVEDAKPQDTVLFYFSGHGLVDPVSRQPFLCLAKTHTDDLGNTGLALQTLLQQLKHCNASKQLVLLDACHSGSMAPLWSGAGVVAPQPDSAHELAAVLQECAAQSRGFCALLSCDEGQRSWEFPDLQHGIFTYYLMQGLQGGATDERGIVEARELYDYVYNQTQQYVESRMRQLHPRDPHNYQQTPRLIMSMAGNLVLGFRPEADDFLRDYEKRLLKYGKEFNTTIQQEYPLNQDTRQQLQRLQQSLGLRSEDTSSTEERIIAIYEPKVRQFEREITTLIHQQYPLNPDAWQQLQRLQQELRLSDLIVALIEAQVTQRYEQTLQQYEVAFTEAIHQQYPLSDEARQPLHQLRQDLNLSRDAVAIIEKRVTAPIETERQRNLQQYEEVFTRAIHRQYPLGSEDREFLANLRRVLNLSEETTQAIEAHVTQGYEQTLQQYEVAFTEAIHQQYPLSDEARQRLHQLRQDLNLSKDAVAIIEKRVTGLIRPNQAGAVMPILAEADHSYLGLSPDQYSHFEERLAELVGPIAPTLLQQVISQATSPDELIENLALYVPLHQQIKFEQWAVSLLQASTVQPQVMLADSASSPSLNQAVSETFVRQCEQALADLIGPIATFLIQDALTADPQISPEALVETLAAEILDPQKAVKFQQRLLP